MLVIHQPELDPGILAWRKQPLHIHRRIIMSHNLVTEIKEKLTHSEMGKTNAFPRDMSTKIAIC